MRVGDLMRKPAVTVVPEASLTAAAQLMERAGVGSLLVVDLLAR